MSSKIIRNISRVIKISKEHGGYFVTTFIASALPILLLPVLTRYLSPSEYANIALFNFYLQISNSLVGTAIPAMISKYFFDRPKEYIAKIVGNSIIIVFVFALLLTIILVSTSSLIIDFVNIPLFWLFVILWTSAKLLLNIAGMTFSSDKSRLFDRRKYV